MFSFILRKGEASAKDKRFPGRYEDDDSNDVEKLDTIDTPPKKKKYSTHAWVIDAETALIKRLLLI